MIMSKNKSILPTYSFADSFKDFKKEKVVVEPKSKKGFTDSSLGKILHAIKVSKNKDLLQDQEIKKDFNAFLIIKWLSMNEEYCELLNYVNGFFDKLDKESLFKLLVDLIPKGKTFDKFIKPDNSVSDFVIDIATYYNVGYKEARTYIDVMGVEWAQTISDKYCNKMSNKKKRGKKKK